MFSNWHRQERLLPTHLKNQFSKFQMKTNVALSTSTTLQAMWLLLRVMILLLSSLSFSLSLSFSRSKRKLFFILSLFGFRTRQQQNKSNSQFELKVSSIFFRITLICIYFSNTPSQGSVIGTWKPLHDLSLSTGHSHWSQLGFNASHTW